MVNRSLLILLFFGMGHCYAQTDSLIDSFLSRKIPAAGQVAGKLVVKKETPGKTAIGTFRPGDTLQLGRDSGRIKPDSLFADSGRIPVQVVEKAVTKSLTWKEDTGFTRLLAPFLGTGKSPPFYMIELVRNTKSKDQLFYLLTGLVAFLAFIKIMFPRYFQNLFRLFFQSSFRQKRKQENLLQDNLPSLLLNLLFVLSGGLFITLVAGNYGWLHLEFWLLFLYCSLLLAVIYGGKFLFISFAGWVFHSPEAAGSYIFIVFLVNKVIGVVLIPLLFLLAFSGGTLANTAVTLALAASILLLAYRYILLLSFVRRNLKVSPIHFFIYLCTVEIIPMLIIYKVLFNKIGQNI